MLESAAGRPLAVPPPAARARALWAFAARRARENGWVRAARWLTPVVGVGFATVMLALRYGAGAPSVDVWLERALLTIAWVGGGLATFGLTRDAAADDEQSGVAALVRQRGFGPAARGRARPMAAAWVVAGTVAPTALALAALLAVLARTVSDLGVAVALAAVTLGHVALVSVSCAALSWTASWLAPSRPRLALAALVCVPELLRASGLAAPSVPAALAAVLARAFAVGIGLA